MIKRIKKIYDIISIVAVVTVAVLAILLVGVRLFGIEPYTVLSGSMEPRYHVGSVIYVKDVRPEELEVGDALTFYLNKTVVTHEIINITDADEPRDMLFETKGLTNNVSDGNIPVSSIIGKPVFSIPKLGYVAEYFQRPTGLITVVCIIAVMLAISFILDIFSKDKKDGSSSEKPRSCSDSPNDPEGNTDEDINKIKED